MAVLPHPPRLPGAPSDKVQHILAFLVLGALARLAYRSTSLVRLFAGLVLFGAVIEAVQIYPPLNRDGSVIDWLVDALAALVALLITGAWLRRWTDGAAPPISPPSQPREDHDPV